MASRVRDHISAALTSAGIMLAGELYFISANSSEAVGTYWKDYFDSDKYFASTASTGGLSTYTLANATTGRNDTFILAPSSHVVQAALTWDRPAVHLIGAYPPVYFGHRSRVSMSSAFSPMMDLAATGSVIANVRLQHGVTGSTAQYIALKVTGNRNYVKSVHVASPMDSTLGDSSGLRSVQLSGAHENVFYKCCFGDDTIDRSTQNALLHFTGSNGKNVFEDCLFNMRIDSSKPFFIQATGAGDINGMVFFKNCHFIARSINNAYTMETMIDADGDLADSLMCFDNNCMTYGVDDICSTAAAAYIKWGAQTGTANVIGLAVSPSTD